MKNAAPVGVRACVFDAYGCNRYRQRPERLPGKPQHEVRSLAELPALLGVPSGG